MTEFTPNAADELFFLVMPNDSRVLMRVTALRDNGNWSATNADLDDAMRAVPPIPEHHMILHGAL